MSDPFSLASGIAGLVSLTIELTKLIHEAINTFRDAPENILQLVRRLEFLQEVLGRVDALLKTEEFSKRALNERAALAHETAFENLAEKSRKSLQKVKAWAQKLIPNSGRLVCVGIRIKWMLDEKDLQDGIQELHELVELFQGCATLEGIALLLKSIKELAALSKLQATLDKQSRTAEDIIHCFEQLSIVGSDVKDIKDNVDKIREHHKEEQLQAQRLKILDWISPERMPSVERHSDVQRAHVLDTGFWFLSHDRFTQWANRSGGGVLWCAGPPGAGKTVMTSIVIEELRNRVSGTDAHVAWLYCDHSADAATQTPERTIACLVRQLLEGMMDMPSSVIALYDECTRAQKVRPPLYKWQALLRSVVELFSYVYVVIDALDEYADGPGLLHAIEEASPSHTFITARDHVDPGSIYSSQYSALPISAAKHDLAMYCQSRFIKFNLVKRLDNSLREEITAAVCHLSGGLFIMAKLHLDTLAGVRSLPRLRHAIATLSGSIYGAYDALFHRIHAQSEDDRELALQVLSFVTFLKRPMSLLEFWHLVTFFDLNNVAFDPDDLYDGAAILAPCLGAVILEKATDTIRLFHFTAEEYFRRGDKLKAADALLAKLCMDYLVQSSRLVLPPFSQWKAIRALPRLELPLLHYTSHFWGKHLSHCELECQGKAVEFLSNQAAVTLYAQCRAGPPVGIGTRGRRYDKYYDFDDSVTYYLGGLHAASSFGLFWIVLTLLQKGADPSAVDAIGVPVICDAVQSGQVKLVEYLCAHGVDVNQPCNVFGSALCIAAEDGHERIVCLLLERGADMNAEGRLHGSPLEAAALSGHESIVRILLERGADVNAQGGLYGSALGAAASSGHESIVRILLEHDADVNAQGGSYGSAIHLAAHSGHENIVHLLLERGADMNAQGGPYSSALPAAVSNGHHNIVLLLLERGADVNAHGGMYGSALQAATLFGHESIVCLLLKRGADVNVQGGELGSALWVAAERGHEDIVCLLLEHGADVNVQGGSALWVAVERGHENIACLLLEHGADANVQVGYQDPVLQAAASGGYESIMRLLLEHGADANVQGGLYYSALQAAVYKGHENIVRLLLEHGANVNAQGGLYGSALQAAAGHGNEDIVCLLLDHGADVNAQGESYGSALQVAVERGHETIACLLLEHGADANVQGGYHDSVLQAAASSGYESIVRLLLERGADVNAQEGRYGSALQAAAAHGYENIVCLLLERGADMNADGGRFGSALEAAVACGHENIVRLLLERGADVNIQGGWYGSALRAAEENGHESIVHILIAHGAIPARVSSDGGRDDKDCTDLYSKSGGDADGDWEDDTDSPSERVRLLSQLPTEAAE